MDHFNGLYHGFNAANVHGGSVLLGRCKGSHWMGSPLQLTAVSTSCSRITLGTRSELLVRWTTLLFATWVAEAIDPNGLSVRVSLWEARRSRWTPQESVWTDVWRSFCSCSLGGKCLTDWGRPGRPVLLRSRRRRRFARSTASLTGSMESTEGDRHYSDWAGAGAILRSFATTVLYSGTQRDRQLRHHGCC